MSELQGHYVKFLDLFEELDDPVEAPQGGPRCRMSIRDMEAGSDDMRRTVEEAYNAATGLSLEAERLERLVFLMVANFQGWTVKSDLDRLKDQFSYFTVGDSPAYDLLLYTDPDEAIYMALDAMDMPLPLEVELCGWLPMAVTKKWADSLAESLAEYAIERLHEEFAHEDSDGEDCLRVTVKEIVAKAKQFTDWFIENSEPTAYEVRHRERVRVKQWMEDRKPELIDVWKPTFQEDLDQ